MRNFILICLLALCRPAAGAELPLNFGDLAASGGLTNFHAEVLGTGRPADWRILPNEAPSAFAPLGGSSNSLSGGSVLAQMNQDPTDEHFPMYIYDGDKFRNFRFSSQFKIVSGFTEQMAGLVFRFQNTSNFYVVRVSALGKNIKFYKVVDGVRSDPIGVACDVAPGTWHDLAVQCDGNQITLWLDRKLAMPPLGDNTFTEGRLGFWTKSDSVTYFANADLNYTPVIPAAQSLIDSVISREPRILNLQIYTLGTNNTTTILASKQRSERGKPGTDAEFAAIHAGTVSYAHTKEGAYITLPLHDRNGEFIAAVRLKLGTFFGETQDHAVNRAMTILKIMEQVGLSANDLMK
jgi:hypothetical protein